MREWNSRDVRTTADRPWYTTALRRLLVSGRIAGQREHNDEIVGPAVWKGIIKPVESTRLRAVLLDPSRRRNAGARRYLLTGLIYCGLCGARLHARPKADHRRCYVCASGPGFGGCGKIRQLAEPLEDLVVRAVFDVVDRPVLLQAAARQKPRAGSESSLAQRIAEDEAQLASLARAWANREITRVEWGAAREPIEQRIRAAHAQLSREQRTTPVDAFRGKSGALSRRWSDMTLDQQRAVVAAIVERVQIGPAVKGRNFFQPERVKVLFRS